jgi:hypothetical protein
MILQPQVSEKRGKSKEEENKKKSISQAKEHMLYFKEIFFAIHKKKCRGCRFNIFHAYFLLLACQYRLLPGQWA